jgi:sirohydrochlorin ferrochelatase
MTRPGYSHPPLVLAAHGSSDPGFAVTMGALADAVAVLRPGLEIRVGYLEHGTATLAEVCDPEAIVVPALLTNGYHAHIDVPTRAGRARIAAPLGPDPRLALAMADRLREAGWRGEHPVVLAAAGSVDERALDDARAAARALARELDVTVRTGFIGSGEPRLDDLDGAAVATYLIGPGRFADLVASQRAAVTAAPLGAHPLLARIILDRFDAAHSLVERVAQPDPATVHYSGRTAPM